MASVSISNNIISASVSTDNPTIKIVGAGHTHPNKIIIDQINEDDLVFIKSGSTVLEDYYNKNTDTALDIVLDTTNFDNNLDVTVTDVQKLADLIDDMQFMDDIDGGLY